MKVFLSFIGILYVLPSLSADLVLPITVHTEGYAKGEKEPYSVVWGMPLTQGVLRSTICTVALEKLNTPKKSISAKTDLQTVIHSETFLGLHQSPKLDGSDLQANIIKQDLMISRAEAGQGHYSWERNFPDQLKVAESEGRGSLLYKSAYDKLLEFQAVVKVGDSVIPVIVSRSDSRIIHIQPGQAHLVPSSWKLTAQPPRTIHPRILAARVTDPDVQLLNADQFSNLSSDVIVRMLSFDFWKESLQLPHALGAYNTFVNTDRNEYDSKGSLIFQILENKRTVGYIMQILFKSEVSEEVYLTGTQIYERYSLYTVRFDAEGNRIDSHGEKQTLTESETFQRYGPGMKNLHR